MIHHSVAAVTTLHLADPQFEHLGPRAFVDNHLVDMFVPPAYRNVTAILTDPLYVDTLLHKTCQGMTSKPRLQLLGDIPDTPCDSEMKDFEAVLQRHDLPVDGYDRGNHSSGNAFGVVNLLSRAYNTIKGWIFKNPNWLEEEQNLMLL